MPEFEEIRSPVFDAALDRLRKRFKRIDRDLEQGIAELRASAEWLRDRVPRYEPAVYKFRIALKSQGIGKSGGLRLVYRPFEEAPGHARAILALLYFHGDQANFTRDEFARALDALRPYLEGPLAEAGLSREQIEELLTP